MNNIYKDNALDLIDTLNELSRLSRVKALDADDATLVAFFRGRADAYELAAKWIWEDVVNVCNSD